jgi:hypothetical protein
MPRQKIPTSSRRQLVIWLSSGVAALVIFAGLLAWSLKPAPLPKPQGLAPVALAKVLASQQFAALTDQEKAPYVHALFAMDPHNAAAMIKSLSPAEQNAAFRNGGYILMTQAADAFFNLKAPMQQTAYLDRVLDWSQAIERAEKEMPNVVDVSQEESRQARDERRSMAQGWIQQLGPSQSARMSEFYKQLVLRRTARNLFNRNR